MRWCVFHAQNTRTYMYVYVRYSVLAETELELGQILLMYLRQKRSDKCFVPPSFCSSRTSSINSLRSIIVTKRFVFLDTILSPKRNELSHNMHTQVCSEMSIDYNKKGDPKARSLFKERKCCKHYLEQNVIVKRWVTKRRKNSQQDLRMAHRHICVRLTVESSLAESQKKLHHHD